MSPDHMCGPPYSKTYYGYGAVWSCPTCGTAWELTVRYKNGPDPVGPGRWERMKDTQAPKWARKNRKKIRNST